jgi:hypothetical protein
VSPSGSAAVFSLHAYADALRAKLRGPDDWEARRDAARSLYLGFYDGFHPVDSSRIGSGRRGRFLVENPSSRSRRATLRMTVRGVTGPSTLRIRGSLLEGDFAIDHEPTVILRTLDVPPGKHWLVADCDGAAWSEIFAGHRVLVVFDEARLYGSIAAPD